MKPKFTLQKADEYIEKAASSVDKTYMGTYHLCSQVGWLNDPNGFVYYKGKYHLFYQYHPYSAEWGPMHWGHAVSGDLVKWEYLPTALAPDSRYDKKGCWSGSALVVGERLYLMYTGLNGFGVKTQNLAYSDDGVNFHKCEENPVITGESFSDKKTLRDPYLWEKEGSYYCLLADRKSAKLYTSKNLTSWRYINNIANNTGEYDFECPCLVTVSGADVLMGSPVRYPQNGDKFGNYSSNVYSVGALDCDGGTFSGTPFDELDSGTDFYAAQSAYGENGEVYTVAWMNMWERKNITLSHGRSGMMTLPRQLSVKNGRLFQRPVQSITKYYKNKITVTESFSGERELDSVNGKTLALKIRCELQNASRFSVRLFSDGKNFLEIAYDRPSGKLIFNTANTLYPTVKNEKENGVRKVGFLPEGNTLDMELFLDNSSVEAFVADGEVTASMLCFNKPSSDRIAFSADGEVKLRVEKNDILF